MRPVATPARVDVVELVAYLPALRAGARALRERGRWAGRVAFLPHTAEEATKDAGRSRGARRLRGLGEGGREIVNRSSTDRR